MLCTWSLGPPGAATSVDSSLVAAPFQNDREGVSVYVSTTRKPLDDVQNVIGDHAINSADGRCVRCKVEGPCRSARDALRQLAAWHQLPRRRAGATRPELIGARRVLARG